MICWDGLGCVLIERLFPSADATVPGVYHRAFAAADVGGLGEVSVNALSRVLATSSLPAATVDKVCTIGILASLSLIIGLDCQLG